MQFKKLNMTSKEEKIKEDEILVKGIIEIYKEILRGDRKQFPKGTWQRPDAIENSKKCVKYLIEEKLKLTDDDITGTATAEFFRNNKLSSMLNRCYNGSPFKAINNVYPRKFKPWEFKSTPMSYWSKTTAKEATRWLVEEKLNLSDEELKECLSIKLFEENNLLGMLTNCFHCSPFEAINNVYPNKFKPWEFKRCVFSYWTRDNGIKAIRWLIEEKLKWSDNDIKEKLSGDTFRENKLGGMLQICFSNSPYEAINATYPNKFKKEDFKSYHISNRL